MLINVLVVTILILLFGLAEMFRYFREQIDVSNSALVSEVERSARLESALNDVVESFGESGLTMHRNTFQKITSINRAKAVLKILNNSN